jgi:hypothetical protein
LNGRYETDKMEVGMKLLSLIYQSQRRVIRYGLFFISLLSLLLPSKASAICIDIYGSVVTAYVNVGTTSIDPVDSIYFYSDIMNVYEDPLYVPKVTGSDGIGTWGYEYVTTDHYGNSLPGGVDGIHFYLTSGDGISNGESAYFKFSSGPAAQWYADYHDTTAGAWTDGVVCTDCLCGSPCPEPGSIVLMGVGLAGILGYRKYSRDLSFTENA